MELESHNYLFLVVLLQGHILEAAFEGFLWQIKDSLSVLVEREVVSKEPANVAEGEGELWMARVMGHVYECGGRTIFIRSSWLV